jgi:hypothetical protein
VATDSEVLVAGKFNRWLDNDNGKITNSYPQWVMKQIDENHYTLRKKIADFREQPRWQFKFVVNREKWSEVPLGAENRVVLDGNVNLMLTIPTTTTNTPSSQN